MISVCLCLLNLSPWNTRVRDGLYKALISDSDFNVEITNELPLQKNYDFLILCGVKLIYKKKLDTQLLRSKVKFIVELGDDGMDPRKTDADLYFFFNPSRQIFYPNYKYLPKFIETDYLFPEHDKKKTIYIDHYRHQNENEKKISQTAIQFIFRQLFPFKKYFNIYFHSEKGIELNPNEISIPKNEKHNYKQIEYKEICKYYRKSHLFFPTHRETQGMLAQEIGSCGGLTVMQEWMYPQSTHYQFNHEIYNFQTGINFNKLIKMCDEYDFIENNRNHVLKNCSFKNFREKLIFELKKIL